MNGELNKRIPIAVPIRALREVSTCDFGVFKFEALATTESRNGIHAVQLCTTAILSHTCDNGIECLSACKPK